MKIRRTLTAALALFGAGLLFGYVVRWTGASDRTVVNSSHSQARGGTASTLPRNGAPAPEAKIVSGDFSARLNALANTSSPHKRTRAIAGLADDLDAREVREALAVLEKSSVRDATEIRLRLLARWAELEPDAALQFAQSLPPGFEAPGAITAVIRSWVAVDAKGAEDGVARMPATFGREIARSALLPAISESDPRRAFALYGQGAQFWSSDLTALFQNWTERNPAEAAAQAALLPAPWQRTQGLHDVMEKWSETDRDAALAWAQAWQPANADGVTIARRDPKPLAAVVQTWMKEEPGAAMQWLEQLPADATKTDVLSLLSRALSGDEPSRAVEVAAMMPAGKAQDNALRRLIGPWVQKDSVGALAWAEQQTDEEVRQIVLPAVAETLASHDPHAALELALSVTGKAGTSALKNVLYLWALKEPAAAAEWAGVQPGNAAYLESVAEAWAEKDGARAFEWVSTIPPGAEKDAALAKGVGMIAQTQEPQTAVEWITAIGSEEKRAVAYQNLAYGWLRSNPKKAREWIKTAPLPANVRADLLKGNSK